MRTPRMGAIRLHGIGHLERGMAEVVQLLLENREIEKAQLHFIRRRMKDALKLRSSFSSTADV